jgi:hypothetical protein
MIGALVTVGGFAAMGGFATRGDAMLAMRSPL